MGQEGQKSPLYRNRASQGSVGYIMVLKDLRPRPPAPVSGGARHTDRNEGMT
jgi:hypothetical protein